MNKSLICLIAVIGLSASIGGAALLSDPRVGGDPVSLASAPDNPTAATLADLPERAAETCVVFRLVDPGVALAPAMVSEFVHQTPRVILASTPALTLTPPSRPFHPRL